MEKKLGFVVIKDGLYYRNNGEFTDDIDKAKDFNSQATAIKIAKKVKGYVRELYYH